ncbi:hypothetical protein [Paracandidimonas soli]|uniref:Uncharacterized protein n=1 Tax=Paracandidimonas soli TaxID=1917182 RepID=A0A4V2VR59_9BURK|nr:hypothetical protein [Paracandidimonas soli]TCU97319.1 hypothetical protein EV686_106202 [Paracandidimonas soli]
MDPILDEANFVSEDIHEREVELGDGKKHLLRFKRLPGVEYYAFVTAQQSRDDDTRARAVARLVSVSLVDAVGDRVLSVERAAALKDSVLNRLLATINKINQGGDGKKSSTPEVTDTSGT